MVTTSCAGGPIYSVHFLLFGAPIVSNLQPAVSHIVNKQLITRRLMSV